MPATSTFDKVVGHALRGVPMAGHEWATHDWIVHEVARLMRLPCMGIDEDGTCHANAFHVPDDTLTSMQAGMLGITGAGQVLGGVVPHAFLATKVVSHPLVNDDAVRVEGWNQELANALVQATLPGYTVFSEADARLGYARLRGSEPVRFKLATGVGGRGQWLVEDASAFEQLLAGLPTGYLATQGVVLERNLRAATTYSVGELHCAGIDVAYHGTQSTVKDEEGRDVYGGSDLWFVRGILSDLAGSALSAAQRLAVQKARLYDGFIAAAYPGLQLSRRNYDVVLGGEGMDETCGVLEQSWRVGGATPAELAAIALFQRDPALCRVHAGTREVYGDGPPPPGAEIYYQAAAPGSGPRFKYRMSSPR